MHKNLFIFSIVALFVIVPALATPPACNDGSGAIWTTTSGCDAVQNENHYVAGETVYIHGDNFCNEPYAWDITGQPGGASGDPSIVVANGTYTPAGSDDFCFAAYTILDDDWGEYQATFGKKHDNYRVDGATIPEFGVIAGAMALVAGLGIVLFRRT